MRLRVDRNSDGRLSRAELILRLRKDGELASLATQVMLSYAFVVKRCVAHNWRPLRLALTNTDAAAATLARIRDAASAEIGDAWPVKVVGSDFATGLPALCAPDAPQIVVLSPDADTPLTTLGSNEKSCRCPKSCKEVGKREGGGG